MAVKIYYDADADLGLLRDKRIAIIGYGSQGHAHAGNLRDSGCNAVVGLYQGSRSAEQAKNDGFEVMNVPEAARSADIVMILVPDQIQRRVYSESIEPNLKQGATLMFAHGFNIHFNQIRPRKDLDVSMIAPKAPGHRMREVFVQGLGVPALVAVYQDASGRALQNALAYGKGVGSTRAGVLETTFLEETETDLFGEQTVLCGGVAQLVKTGFEVLVEAGYQPESAYFETMHELKLIVDLMYEGGLEYMRFSVSDTAEYGDYVSGKRVIDEHVKENMKKVLADIRDGSFASRWMLENQAGQSEFLAMRRLEASHPIEVTGKQLRAMMPWLKKK